MHIIHHKLLHVVLGLVLGHGVPKKYAVPLFIAGQFDAATTYVSVRGNPYVHEINPLLRPFAKYPTVFPAIAIGDVGYNLVNRRLYAHHKRWVVVVIGTEIALHIYCGVNNIHVYQQTHR